MWNINSGVVSAFAMFFSFFALYGLKPPFRSLQSFLVDSTFQNIREQFELNFNLVRDTVTVLTLLSMLYMSNVTERLRRNWPARLLLPDNKHKDCKLLWGGSSTRSVFFFLYIFFLLALHIKSLCHNLWKGIVGGRCHFDRKPTASRTTRYVWQIYGYLFKYFR